MPCAGEDDPTRRGRRCVKRSRETRAVQETGKDVQTKLDLISQRARKDPQGRINNIAYLLNEENLRDCFGQLKKGKAAGVDGVTLEEYESNLDENLQELVGRMKRQAYKPQPVRRTYTPKANGQQRPLGIPAIEDKIVQKGMTRILEAIYEADFLECSYGFRAGRGCHQALKSLDKIIMTKPINHIIDADIKGFFDHVDHDGMRKFLEHRISDPNFIRLASRFLRNGYMENGRVHDVEEGTPQGGNISPMLANIYLHYVLDQWVEKEVKAKCKGVVEMVRYADDFVICVEHENEAAEILDVLRKRLAKFGLELAEDKTRCIEFGRKAKQKAEAKGVKPATFVFLGFTHFIDKTRKGGFKVGRKTERRRMAMKLKALGEWLKMIRNMIPLKELWRILKAKLAGHFQYYGVSGNSRAIRNYRYQSIRLAMKWLNRRSQKKSFNWETFNKYMERFPLPKARIHHSFYDLKANA